MEDERVLNIVIQGSPFFERNTAEVSNLSTGLAKPIDSVRLG
jgi:hypothetical protein